METSPVFGECYTKWQDLACKLDIDVDTKKIQGALHWNHLIERVTCFWIF